MGSVQVCGQQRVFAAVHGLRHDTHHCIFDGFESGRSKVLICRVISGGSQWFDHDDGSDAVFEVSSISKATAYRRRACYRELVRILISLSSWWATA